MGNEQQVGQSKDLKICLNEMSIADYDRVKKGDQVNYIIIKKNKIIISSYHLFPNGSYDCPKYISLDSHTIPISNTVKNIEIFSKDEWVNLYSLSIEGNPNRQIQLLGRIKLNDINESENSQSKIIVDTIDHHLGSVSLSNKSEIIFPLNQIKSHVDCIKLSDFEGKKLTSDAVLFYGRYGGNKGNIKADRVIFTGSTSQYSNLTECKEVRFQGYSSQNGIIKNSQIVRFENSANNAGFISKCKVVSFKDYAKNSQTGQVSNISYAVTFHNFAYNTGLVKDIPVIICKGNVENWGRLEGKYIFNKSSHPSMQNLPKSNYSRKAILHEVFGAVKPKSLPKAEFNKIKDTIFCQ